MCDLNGHINNSLYLDIACDALPQEVVEAAPLSFASIKYHREVPMGQSVQVFYAPSKEGWYVLGRREEHAAFECYLEFGEPVTESLQKRTAFVNDYVLFRQKITFYAEKERKRKGCYALCTTALDRIDQLNLKILRSWR